MVAGLRTHSLPMGGRGARQHGHTILARHGAPRLACVAGVVAGRCWGVGTFGRTRSAGALARTACGMRIACRLPPRHCVHVCMYVLVCVCTLKVHLFEARRPQTGMGPLNWTAERSKPNFCTHARLTSPSACCATASMLHGTWGLACAGRGRTLAVCQRVRTQICAWVIPWVCGCRIHTHFLRFLKSTVRHGYCCCVDAGIRNGPRLRSRNGWVLIGTPDATAEFDICRCTAMCVCAQCHPATGPFPLH